MKRITQYINKTKMRTKEEILGKITGMTLDDESAYIIHTKLEYVLKAMQEYADQSQEPKQIDQEEIVNQLSQINPYKTMDNQKAYVSGIELGLRKGLELEPKQMEVSEEIDQLLIESMCLRYRHDFGFLNENQKESIRITMTQLWEEVVGKGFYKKKQSQSMKEREVIDWKQITIDFMALEGHGNMTRYEVLKWFRDNLFKSKTN